MNTTILTGNLGSDVESFYSPNDGTHIVSFPIAFRSTKDKTNWIKITCFGKTAELAETHLHKGAKIGVTGILDQDKWEKNGETKTMLKLIANSIEFIKTDGRGYEDKKNNGKDSNSSYQNDEEIPF